MNTTTITIELNDEFLPVFESLFKQFKVKNKIIKEEKDPTKMSQEEFFAKIENGLQEYEMGKSKEFKTFKDFQNYISK